MKRLLLMLMLLCMPPVLVLGAGVPVRTPDPSSLTDAADPEESPVPIPPDASSLTDAAESDDSPVLIPPDPNWVPAAEQDEETAEAFKTFGATPRSHGMRPLSPYAQVFSVTEDDLVLAARVAYFEAGPRSERAYRAVLCVLYNRCVAKRFGGKVTDIATETYRKGQFSVIHNKRFKSFDPPGEIIEAARDIFVYGNLDLPENILFFCAESIGKRFGGHKFYKNIGGNLFFYGRVD